MYIKLLIITLTAFVFSSIEQINTEIDNITGLYQTNPQQSKQVGPSFNKIQKVLNENENKIEQDSKHSIEGKHIFNIFFERSEEFFDRLVTDFIEYNCHHCNDLEFACEDTHSKIVNMLHKYLSLSVYRSKFQILPSNLPEGVNEKIQQFLLPYNEPKDFVVDWGTWHYRTTNGNNRETSERIKQKIAVYWLSKLSDNQARDLLIKMPVKLFVWLDGIFFSRKFFNDLLSRQFLLDLGIDKVKKSECLWEVLLESQKQLFMELYDLNKDFCMELISIRGTIAGVLFHRMGMRDKATLTLEHSTKIPGHYHAWSIIAKDNPQFFAQKIKSLAFHLIAHEDIETITKVMNLQTDKSLDNLIELVLLIYQEGNGREQLLLDVHHNIFKNFIALAKLSENVSEEGKALCSSKIEQEEQYLTKRKESRVLLHWGSEAPFYDEFYQAFSPHFTTVTEDYMKKCW